MDDGDALLQRHRPRSAGARIAFFGDERARAADVVRVQHAHRNAAIDSRRDRLRMQHLGPEPRQLRRLDVRNAVDDPRRGDEARIARHHAVDVRPYLDLTRARRRADDRRAVVRAAASEGRRRAVDGPSDEAAHHRDQIPLDQRHKHALCGLRGLVHQRTGLAEARVGDHDLFRIDELTGQRPHHHRVGEED